MAPDPTPRPRDHWIEGAWRVFGVKRPAAAGALWNAPATLTQAEAQQRIEAFLGTPVLNAPPVPEAPAPEYREPVLREGVITNGDLLVYDDDEEGMVALNTPAVRGRVLTSQESGEPVWAPGGDGGVLAITTSEVAVGTTASNAMEWLTGVAAHFTLDEPTFVDVTGYVPCSQVNGAGHRLTLGVEVDGKLRGYARHQGATFVSGQTSQLVGGLTAEAKQILLPAGYHTVRLVGMGHTANGGAGATASWFANLLSFGNAPAPYGANDGLPTGEMFIEVRRAAQ